MYILKNKKGFTLVEVMIGVVIFTIMFLAYISLYSSFMKLKIYNDKINDYRLCVETVRNRMLCDFTYEELIELRNDGRIYVNKTCMNFQKLKNGIISDIFNREVETEELYIKAVIEGEEVLKVELQFTAKIFKREENIIYEFYKGSY